MSETESMERSHSWESPWKYHQWGQSETRPGPGPWILSEYKPFNSINAATKSLGVTGEETFVTGKDYVVRLNTVRNVWTESLCGVWIHHDMTPSEFSSVFLATEKQIYSCDKKSLVDSTVGHAERIGRQQTESRLRFRTNNFHSKQSLVRFNYI